MISLHDDLHADHIRMHMQITSSTNVHKHAKYSTFSKLQRRSQTASGPPFLKSWIEMDATLLAGIRPAVFSSTH